MDSDELKCSYCAETINPAAIRCKYCHADREYGLAELPDPPLSPRFGVFGKIVLGIFAALILFLTFGAIVGNSPESQAKSRVRALINLCHREEGLYAGGACQKLENDFRSQFGHTP